MSLAMHRGTTILQDSMSELSLEAQNPNHRGVAMDSETDTDTESSDGEMIIQPLNSKMRSTMAPHELGTMLESIREGSRAKMEVRRSPASRQINRSPQPPQRTNNNRGIGAASRSVIVPIKTNETKNKKSTTSGNKSHGPVMKKDFDRSPGKMDFLSPPLPKLPYEPPTMSHDEIIKRDSILPGASKTKSKQVAIRHPKSWNSQTKKGSWKPIEERSILRTTKEVELRSLDKFVHPKDWRLLHPEENQVGMKKDNLMLALEAKRKSPDREKSTNEDPKVIKPPTSTFLTQGDEEQNSTSNPNGIAKPGNSKKAKFNPSAHVKEQRERKAQLALLRAQQLSEKGSSAVEIPFKDRPGANSTAGKRPRRKAESPKWDTNRVNAMLKSLLHTEDLKLKALEHQLKVVSKKVASTHGGIHTLVPIRQDIQKIRFRVADLREALGYVNKKNWQKDIMNMLISSNVPLDKFLKDCSNLEGDVKYFAEDSPW